MKKRVIIPLESRPYFTEMLRVAGLIKKKSNYEVIFLLNSEIQCDEREILKEHEIGYSVFSPESRAPQKLGFVGKVLFRFSIAQFVLSLENFLRLKKVAARFVKDLAPSLIVFPHIEWGRLSGFMLLESLNHQIPTLVIPYAWNPVKESVVARLSQRPYQLTFWRKCILKIFNLEKKHKWVRQGVIQQPLPGLIALEFARGVRHDAWNASALASFTGVESEMMLRSFIDDGGSTDRCFIVG
ncbi:MAG TPA: hypothetical protein PLU50_09790, partial [Pseudobdellovibrionaceae bacterium]|nr:hypothetical protein [Pseudobdellovibrionaceae bacterium]